MKSRLCFALVFSFGVLLFSESHAEPLSLSDSGRLYFLASKYQAGWILIDNPSTAYLVQNNPWMAELDFSILKNTQRAWDECKCYSKDGASLSYVNFGNPENLGSAINLALYVEPYISFSKKLQFSFRGGVGLSYLNKIYDVQTNPDNLFYSRHLSFLLMLNINAYYSVSPKLRLSLTAQFSHISNGGTRDPNWGMNFPTVGLGLEYLVNPQKLLRRESTPFTNRSIKIISHLFGGQRILPANDAWPEERKIVLGLNSGIIKPLSRINGLGLGGELYYDGITQVQQERAGENFSPWIGSVSLQHYLFFGRILFGQQLAYQFTPLNPNVSSRIYERYFLEYRIMKHWYGGVSLKAYGDRSDYFTLSTAFVL